MARVGRIRIPCYGRGGEICLFRLLRFFSGGRGTQRLGEAALIRTLEEGGQRRKDALFLQSVEKSCLAGLLHVNAGGIG